MSCRCFCYLNDFRGNSLKHFLEYAKARMLEDLHAETYRVYVSDTLRIISENTARFGGGAYTKQRYYDVINPPKVDTRTGDEIAADIIKRAGLKVKGVT